MMSYQKICQPAHARLSSYLPLWIAQEDVTSVTLTDGAGVDRILLQITNKSRSVKIQAD